MKLVLKAILILLATASMLACENTQGNQGAPQGLFGIILGEVFVESKFQIEKKAVLGSGFNQIKYGGPSVIEYKVKNVPEPIEYFKTFTILVSPTGKVFGIGGSGDSACGANKTSYRTLVSMLTEKYGAPSKVESERVGGHGATTTWFYNDVPKAELSISCYSDGSMSVFLEDYRINARGFLEGASKGIDAEKAKINSKGL